MRCDDRDALYIGNNLAVASLYHVNCPLTEAPRRRQQQQQQHRWYLIFHDSRQQTSRSWRGSSADNRCQPNGSLSARLLAWSLGWCDTSYDAMYITERRRHAPTLRYRRQSGRCSMSVARDTQAARPGYTVSITRRPAPCGFLSTWVVRRRQWSGQQKLPTDDVRPGHSMGKLSIIADWCS